jgi:hypothetical protein
MTVEEIKQADDDGARFSVAGYGGIAFYLLAEETEPDEETVWSGYEIPTGRVLMVMVGDDYKHSVDPDDVTALDPEAFCRDCGQVGCTSNVYS